MRTKLNTIFSVPHVVHSAKTLEVPLPSKDLAYRPYERRTGLQGIPLTDTVDFCERLSYHYVLCSFVFDSLQVSGPDNLHDLRVGLD